MYERSLHMSLTKEEKLLGDLLEMLSTQQQLHLSFWNYLV